MYDKPQRLIYCIIVGLLIWTVLLGYVFGKDVQTCKATVSNETCFHSTNR